MVDYLQKIYLAPVSSSALYENYKRTVVSGITKNDFFYFKNSAIHKKICSDTERIRIWGIKEKKVSQFNKVNVNDFVLFYNSGYIVGSANVKAKDKNLELSKQIWGFDYNKIKKTNEYWENLLFLDNYIDVHINFKEFIDYANYSPKASVRGFNPYSSVGTNFIIDRFGSIMNFLNNIK